LVARWSRNAVFRDDRIKAVVFGFGRGQELSEHAAAKSAMLLLVLL